jgi:ABC-type Zn uptake system ZnuABC Zn-binding protein ZnuA
MTVPVRRRLAPIWIIGALAVGVAACGDDSGASGSSDENAAARTALADYQCPAQATAAGESRPGPAGGGKLQVIATVAPLTSIVANVSGGLADVRGVIPEGEDSHTYEPKPSVAAMLAKADVVFINGLKLEDPTRELADANVPGTGQVVELGTLAITPAQHLYDFSFPRDGGKPNPHLWTNPPMVACYARTVASVLGKADPANAAAYRANADKYVAKVDELDRLFVAATETVPAGNRKLLTYHDAYAYFGVRYGWSIVGAIQVSSFEDPTPKEVANLITQVKKEKLPAIFGSEVFPSKVLEQIAKESGASYVDVLRDDDLPGNPGDEDHSLLGLLKFDFVTIVKAMGGNPSVLEAFDPSDVTKDTADYPQ